MAQERIKGQTKCEGTAQKTECADLEARQTFLRMSKHPVEHQLELFNIEKNEEGWHYKCIVQMLREE